MEDFFSQVKLLLFFIWTHLERTMIYIWINIWLTVLWNSVFLQVRVYLIVQCTLVCPSLPTFILQDIFLSILFRCLSDQIFPALHSEKSTVARFRGWKRRWSRIWTLMRFQDTYGHWDPPLYLGEKEAEKRRIFQKPKQVSAKVRRFGEISWKLGESSKKTDILQSGWP